MRQKITSVEGIIPGQLYKIIGADTLAGRTFVYDDGGLYARAPKRILPAERHPSERVR